MHKLFATLLLILPLASAPALAQDKKDTSPAAAAPAATPSCKTQAEGKSGAERRAFMKDCRAKKASARGGNQAKFGACSSSLKGQKLPKAERSAKMKECMAK
jgi:hypothetical protein